MDMHFLEHFEGPSRYVGNELNAIHKDWGQRFHIAIGYPDLYEVGMSSHGLRILYHLLNEAEGTVAERFFAPYRDMEAWLREHHTPLFSLESWHPLNDFDVLAFSLATELTYTNTLNILDLSLLPVRAADRPDWPIVIAGGTCAFNPEPMAPFIDAFLIGDGEEVLPEAVECLSTARRSGLPKQAALEDLAQHVAGVYVPALYETATPPSSSHGPYTIVRPLPGSGAPPVVAKRTLEDLDTAYSPTRPIVPYRELVHDRGVIELFRGCVRGCRFCEAGISYRPTRERSLATIQKQLEQLVANTGYEEIGLLSLSSTDYSDLPGLVHLVQAYREHEKIAISFPSLRMEHFPDFLADEIKQTREGSLTFAIEAGNQRLRDIINKNITEESIFTTLKTVFGKGWHLVKFYFMFGLPTETDDDLDAMIDLVRRIYEFGKGFRRDIGINLSVNPFVPRPDTPFQWCAQCTQDTYEAKIEHLRKGFHLLKGKVHVEFGDPRTALLEGLLSRGDRRVADVIQHAWETGAKLDGWRESFRFDLWQQAIASCSFDTVPILHAALPETTALPWEIIDAGVSTDFLRREYHAAMKGERTPTCRETGCHACGVQERLHPCPTAKIRDVRY